MITLISPKKNNVFSLLSAPQKDFIEKSLSMDVKTINNTVENPYEWLPDLDEEDAFITQPASIIIRWKNSDHYNETKILLSTSSDFSETKYVGSVGSIHYSASDDYYYASAFNLLSGYTYYLKIICGNAESEVRSFSTVYGEIRTIRADGSRNIRDTGGRVNRDGHRIKQGLIFRGAHLNDLILPKNASLNGMEILRDKLKIKTDIDLRWEAVGKYEFCPLGDHVNYKLFTLEGYEGIFKCGQDGLFKEIFELFADENNYPIYYHCVSGADRTGTVGLLLDAVLGLSDENIILNYNITSLSTIRCIYTDGAEFLKELNRRFPGMSLSEQLMETVYSFGISDELINRIRRNLLEN